MNKWIVLILFILLGQFIIWDLWHNVWINIANIIMWLFALRITVWSEHDQIL